MSTPAHQRIADDIRNQVRSGALAPESRLPTAVQLAKQWQVSGAVITQALGTLKAEGLLSSAPGRGTFVRAPRKLLTWTLSGFESHRRDSYSADAWALAVEQQGMKPSATAEVRRIKADRLVAEWLEVAEGETVIVRDRVRYADNEPYMLSTSYFPSWVAAGTRLEEPGDQSAPGGLLVEVGHPQTRVRDVVSAPVASGDQLRRLGLPGGAKAWSVVRIGYGRDGRPVRAMHTIAPLDTWQLGFAQTVRPHEIESPFLCADFASDPYPGQRPEVSFVELDGAAWVTSGSADNRSGWAVHLSPDRLLDLDEWLASRGAPKLEARLPLLAYGSNASPGKIEWLRGQGLRGPCVVMEADVEGVAAVWAAGLRMRDDQRPAILAAADGIERHCIWWVTAEQRRIFDKIEGRGERYRLGWVRVSTTIHGWTRLKWVLAYVARPEVLGQNVNIRLNRSPLLVDGRPVRVTDMSQAQVRTLAGEIGDSDWLCVVEVAGEPSWGDIEDADELEP